MIWIEISLKKLIRITCILAAAIALTGCFGQKKTDSDQANTNQQNDSADVQESKQASENDSAGENNLDSDPQTEETNDSSAGNVAGTKEDEVDFSAPDQGNNESTASEPQDNTADTTEPDSSAPQGLTAADDMVIIDDQLIQDAEGNNDSSWGPLD